MDLFHALDLIGTAVFAISGATTAMEKKLDVFGILTVAFVTSIGGGTIRDILLGYTPVGWMLNTHYLIAIVIGVGLAMVAQKQLVKLRKTLFLFDSIGLGVFTITGLEKALDLELSYPVAIMMGTTSAVMGGVIRDIICNELPIIFRKEIYASASIVGGSGYLFLNYAGLDNSIVIIGTIIFIIIIRILAIVNNWSLTFVHHQHDT